MVITVGIAYMHIMEAIIDFRELAFMCDVIVDSHLALKIVCDKMTVIRELQSTTNSIFPTFYQTRDFSSALDATKGTSTPYTSSNKLESVFLV